MSQCCPLSSVVSGHWAQCWVSACCFHNTGPSRLSAQQAHMCCVFLVLTPRTRHCLIAPEKSQKCSHSKLPQNHVTEYLPQPKTPRSSSSGQERQCLSIWPRAFEDTPWGAGLWYFYQHTAPQNTWSGGGGVDC